MFCENCGAKLEDGDRFCVECGTPVEEAPGELTSGMPEPRQEKVYTGYPQPQQQAVYPPKSADDKKSPVVPILIAVCVLLFAVIIVGALFFLRNRSDHDGTADEQGYDDPSEYMDPIKEESVKPEPVREESEEGIVTPEPEEEVIPDKADEETGNEDMKSNGSGLFSGDPSEIAVTGGKWEQMESGEHVYTKDGKSVYNTWAEDDGEYYYLGPDGCLAFNVFTPDGYWADANGEWDRSVERRDSDIDILNNDYTGEFGDIWSIQLEDGSDGGTARFKYSLSDKWREFTLEPNGIGTYVAISRDNDLEKYLISVMDDGWSIHVSGAGFTDKYIIE